MGYIRAFLLIATSFAMGAALAISLTTVLPSLPVLLATLGWILVALHVLINKRDSCKGSKDIGSISGKTKR
jgi:hypothetical protein